MRTLLVALAGGTILSGCAAPQAQVAPPAPAVAAATAEPAPAPGPKPQYGSFGFDTA